MDDEKLLQAAAWLREAERVVVFTGAGVSAESGIPTFRDGGGLWREFAPEQFATTTGLLATAARRPAELARFLLAVLRPIALARPNDGHRALAALEGRGKDVQVVTQNIDGLHQEAGSRVVHEVHGSLLEVVGVTGHVVRSLSRKQLVEMVRALEEAERKRFAFARVTAAVRPLLGLGDGVMHRPRVVLFGEPMAEPDWSRAQTAARRCDVMLTVGTSGDVWPAAGLPQDAHDAGARVIAVNPDDVFCDVWLEGRAASALPTLVSRAFGT